MCGDLCGGRPFRFATCQRLRPPDGLVPLAGEIVSAFRRPARFSPMPPVWPAKTPLPLPRRGGSIGVVDIGLRHALFAAS